MIGWRSGLVLLVVLGAGCYRARFRADAPKLDCLSLPNEGWQKLCKRFEPELELIHAGHAQLIGERTWSCTEASAYRVHCLAPVNKEELEALRAWVSDQAGVHERTNLSQCLWLLLDRLEMLAAPPIPADSTMVNYRPKRCRN